MTQSSSDIVERLRVWPATDGEQGSDAFSSHFVSALMKEAADEIERLRGVAQTQSTAARLSRECLENLNATDDGDPAGNLLHVLKRGFASLGWAQPSLAADALIEALRPAQQPKSMWQRPEYDPERSLIEAVKEMAAPQPAGVAQTPGSPVSFINRRLEDLAEANALYGKDQRLSARHKIARNDREISWLKELRSMLAYSMPSTDAETARKARAQAEPKPYPIFKCMGRRQSLPEPAGCNWPDCGCDPYATKVIESLLEQGWTGPAVPSTQSEIKPHPYSPDYQAMGDCRVCGHERDKPWHTVSATNKGPDHA